MPGPDETYRHWLQLRLGQSFDDEVMSPDQAVVWHELCRELRLGPRALADDADEAAIAGAGAAIEECLSGHDSKAISPLWAIGSVRSCGCTLVHDLLLGLCGPPGAPARRRLGDALPVPLLLAGRTVRGPLGMLGMDVRWDSPGSVAAALGRWWTLAEHDIRRGVERTFSAAALRDPPAGDRPGAITTGGSSSPSRVILIGGVDELPERARATVLGWVAELCEAGAPVLVTTCSPALAELAALCERGQLRRVFIQPLARPAIDRFVTTWVRLPGEFEQPGAAQIQAAIDGSPGLLALARRPATLAMLTVALARGEPAPGTLSALERGLLAGLDPQRPAHRLLMARIVAERDCAIERDERAQWLTALVAAGALHDHPQLGEALGRDPTLAEAGAALLHDAAQAWASGACPLAQLRARVPDSLGHVTRDAHAGAAADVPDSRAHALRDAGAASGAAADVPDSRAHVVWDADTAADAAANAPDSRAHVIRDAAANAPGSLAPIVARDVLVDPVDEAARDDAMARLLVLGRHAGWWRPEHAFVLNRGLPGPRRLFECGPSVIRARPLFTALAELQEVWGAYALPLLRVAPLGYLLAEGGAVCPVAAAALFAEAPPPEVRPIRDLFQRALLLELALVSLAADDEALQHEVLGIVLARDRDLDAALDRALLAELGEARPPGPRGPAGLSERLIHIDAALELASRLTPGGAPELARDLERARALVAGGPELDPPLRRLAAFVVAILLYAIDRRLLPGPTELRRNDVQALLASLARPDTVAAAFPEERRAQIVADWQWVSRQVWAPPRIAETLLLHMPATLSLAPADVLPRAHTWLRAFLAAHG